MLQKSHRFDGVLLVLCFDRDGHSVPESHVHIVHRPAAQQLGAIDVGAVDEKPVRENELSLHEKKACACTLWLCNSKNYSPWRIISPQPSLAISSSWSSCSDAFKEAFPAHGMKDKICRCCGGIMKEPRPDNPNVCLVCDESVWVDGPESAGNGALPPPTVDLPGTASGTAASQEKSARRKNK
jgi:hypothetical protein